MNASRFIACGMYAPNDDIKNAWQALFDQFYALVGPISGLQQRLVFGTDESLLRDPGLLIGHTCGYPLMTGLQDAVMPFCAPCFEVPGAIGKLYSSLFIVPADSSLESLQQCCGGIVAINDANSNSGMNVLRYALAKLKAGPGYFSDVLMTGGHLASLEAVAANRAQLAAIDCVSYQLLTARNPGLDHAIRVIGFSDRLAACPWSWRARNTRDNNATAISRHSIRRCGRPPMKSSRRFTSIVSKAPNWTIIDRSSRSKTMPSKPVTRR